MADLIRHPVLTSFRGAAAGFQVIGSADGRLVLQDMLYPDAPAGGNATANGMTLIATASVIAGAASGIATASGQVLTGTVSFIAGAASGAAQASGQMLAATASFVPASATGAASGSGSAQTATSALVGGAASGAAGAAGATVQATTALISGAASGAGAVNGNASGETIVVATALFVGVADGESDFLIGGGWPHPAALPQFVTRKDGLAKGAVLHQLARIDVGDARSGEGAEAGGAHLPAGVTLLTGRAAGRKSAALIDTELFMMAA